MSLGLNELHFVASLLWVVSITMILLAPRRLFAVARWFWLVGCGLMLVAWLVWLVTNIN